MQVGGLLFVFLVLCVTKFAYRVYAELDLKKRRDAFNNEIKMKMLSDRLWQEEHDPAYLKALREYESKLPSESHTTDIRSLT